jgi:hypothetical protein
MTNYDIIVINIRKDGKMRAEFFVNHAMDIKSYLLSATFGLEIDGVVYRDRRGRDLKMALNMHSVTFDSIES